MTNLHPDRQNNLVSFLRHNQPVSPPCPVDLEQRIMDSLEPQHHKRKRYIKVVWSIPSAIATGFLFTTVSFSVKTPRIALEPQDIESFLVNNWQDTLDTSDFVVVEDHEAHWLLPAVSESQPALSLSMQ